MLPQPILCMCKCVPCIYQKQSAHPPDFSIQRTNLCFTNILQISRLKKWDKIQTLHQPIFQAIYKYVSGLFCIQPPTKRLGFHNVPLASLSYPVVLYEQYCAQPESVLCCVLFYHPINIITTIKLSSLFLILDSMGPCSNGFTRLSAVVRSVVFFI